MEFDVFRSHSTQNGEPRSGPSAFTGDGIGVSFGSGGGGNDELELIAGPTGIRRGLAEGAEVGATGCVLIGAGGLLVIDGNGWGGGICGEGKGVARGGSLVGFSSFFGL